jgi:DNA-binding NtrC family response regulator
MTEPAVEAETSAAQSEMPRAKDGETVLVVEDHADVLAYSMDALESPGYHVIATKDAASAQVAVDTHPAIALLFADVELPGLNGPELVQEVLRRRPGLAVLYTTGSPANAVVHRGLLGREVRAISKPFVLADLATTVRDAIDNTVG